MENYKVYKHIFPNGKIYIGLTCNNLNERWKNGFGYITQTRIFSAIVKYGWDNIKHEILYENLSKEQAFKTEEDLIISLKSYLKEYGYNIISNKERLKTKSNKTHSEIMKEYYSDYNNRLKLRNRKSVNKPVLCIETNIIYKSTAEATRKTGCGHISACCKNPNMTSHGYHWRYAEK